MPQRLLGRLLHVWNRPPIVLHSRERSPRARNPKIVTHTFECLNRLLCNFPSLFSRTFRIGEYPNFAPLQERAPFHCPLAESTR